MAITSLTFQYISASFQNLAQISSSGELFDGVGTQINTLDVNNIVATSITASGILITPSVSPYIIDSDLTVYGTLTAEQYIISSSVINETTLNISGSTKFGNSSDDIHQYTGSLSLTGSANFYGNVVITGSLTVTSSNTFTNYGPTILYGDVTITGTVSSSSTITGSLYGTASNAVTASYSLTTKAAGSVSNVQYNNNDILAGSGRFTFDGTTVNISNGGTLTATGSLFGTASYALNAVGGSGVGFPFSGSAIITGSLQVYQNVSTASLNTSARNLIDSNNNTSLDWNIRRTNDTGSVLSIDWNDRILYKDGATPTVEWGTFILKDQNKVNSIIWNSRRAYDTAASQSIDWNGRSLLASDGVTAVIDWNNFLLKNSTGAQSINWNTGYGYNSEGNFITLDWASALLNDTNGTGSVDWSARVLRDASGVNTSVDWQNRTLYYTDGTITIIDWANSVVNDRFGALAIDWGDTGRTLYDAASSISVNWNNRQLIKSDGTTVAFDWENGQITGSFDVSGSQIILNTDTFQLNSGPSGTVMEITLGSGLFLYDLTGNTSINVDARTNNDNVGNNSVDWNNRQLIKSDGTTVAFDWENGTMAISLAQGLNTTASGSYSHAEGESTQAIGDYSHAEGYQTQVIGNYSHAEGRGTQAIGGYSHAEGEGTQAIGDYSHAEGAYTIASGSYQHVSGQYNTHGDTTSLFIIGNGADDNNRSDIVRVTTTDVQVTGSLNVTDGIIGFAPVNNTAIVSSQNLSSLSAGNLYEVSASASPITLTVTTGSVAGSEYTFYASTIAGGDVDFASGAGMTILSEGSKLKMNAQYSVVTVKYLSTTKTLLIGSLKA